MTNMQGTHVPDYVALGFDQIDRDLAYLIGCFREVLTELGHGGSRPSTCPGRATPPSPPRNCPNNSAWCTPSRFRFSTWWRKTAAETMRDLREAHEDLVAERGLWADQLTPLRESGYTATEIARVLADVRVQPVLTAHPTEAKRLAVLDHHRGAFCAAGRNHARGKVTERAPNQSSNGCGEQGKSCSKNLR
jgi:phosphoenolpyruvate carboxylase